MDALYQILGAVIGYLIALLVRRINRRRFWEQIQKSAQHYLEDPEVPISIPRVATERALADAQQREVERITRSIKPSSPPPHPDSRHHVERPITTNPYHLTKKKADHDK